MNCSKITKINKVQKHKRESKLKKRQSRKHNKKQKWRPDPSLFQTLLPTDLEDCRHPMASLRHTAQPFARVRSSTARLQKVKLLQMVESLKMLPPKLQVNLYHLKSNLTPLLQTSRPLRLLQLRTLTTHMLETHSSLPQLRDDSLEESSSSRRRVYLGTRTLERLMHRRSRRWISLQ
jgi:hypothetical protein